MNTGNPIVDKVGEINFSGNIIPQAWYSTVKRETGKPYLTAIIILADIVYWYRPTEVRDEQTGQIIEFQKKFKNDKLQRSYQQIADMFGISKKEATNAVVFLEKLGVLKREFRTISVNGIVANNVLFIDLIPEKLKEITFPYHTKDTPITFSGERSTENKRELSAQSGETNTKNITEIIPNNLPNKKKERKKTSYDDILSAVEDDNLRDLYYEYIKMRKFIKSPMTDRALTMLMKKVAELEPSNIERQKQLLETAIMNNWKSVYPIKDNNRYSANSAATIGANGIAISNENSDLDEYF